MQNDNGNVMLNKIKEFIATCPYLNNGKINIDYLGDKVGSYVIEITPGTPIVKQYTANLSLKQLLFTFASREPYGLDVVQNIINSGFYENFSNWIETQNNAGNLPEIDNIQTIECLTPGYSMQVSEDTAMYQIQMRITYLKED